MSRADVLLCDSRSPWQRGTNESTHGLLRDYFPKGASVAGHRPAHLLAVENELNHRPGLVLQDRRPADLLTAVAAAEGPSVLRRRRELTWPQGVSFLPPSTAISSMT